MINLKSSFEEEKKKIKKSFSTENSGLKNCRRNSDLVDKVINQIFSYQKKEKKSLSKSFLYPPLAVTADDNWHHSLT